VAERGAVAAIVGGAGISPTALWLPKILTIFGRYRALGMP